MITIIDYDTGNLRSVQNMFKSLGIESTFAARAEEIKAASKIILPGVGHFDFGMRNLNEQGLVLNCSPT